MCHWGSRYEVSSSNDVSCHELLLGGFQREVGDVPILQMGKLSLRAVR